MEYYLLKTEGVTEVDINQLSDTDIEEIALGKTSLLREMYCRDIPYCLRNRIDDYWKKVEKKKIAEEVEKHKREQQAKMEQQAKAKQQ